MKTCEVCKHYMPLPMKEEGTKAYGRCHLNCNNVWHDSTCYVFEHKDHDAKESARLRDEGMAKVKGQDENAEWKEACHAACEILFARGVPFTAEDVRLEMPEDIPHTHHNIMGATMPHWCRKAGLVNLGSVKSKRKKSHAAPITLWGWSA